eukprot:CAMPEP_0113514954 /NCGR_PEP_ID=MMETSP0014_2-20120614/40683_1 /TAXON_ID=2857 /ORGANISM="Nitzschia sp." /LENGTH=560 /DNA_ID=CAMNT_0000411483 /DNA_START=402 /DNA_END=2081 /DNA_ORIENTATION=- /assembly_acc=CAM_ASM_000159
MPLTTMKAVWLVQLFLAVVVTTTTTTTTTVHAFTTGPLLADPNNVGVNHGAGGTSTKTSTASIIPLSAGIGYDGPKRFDFGGGGGAGDRFGGYGGGGMMHGRGGPSRYGYGPRYGDSGGGRYRRRNRNRNGRSVRSGSGSGSGSFTGGALQMANYMGNGRRGNEYYGGEYFGNRYDDSSNGNLQQQQQQQYRGGGPDQYQQRGGGRSMQYSNSRSGYDDNRMGGRRDYDYGPMSSGRAGRYSSRSGGGGSANRFYNNDYDDLPRGDMMRGGSGRGGIGYDRLYNDYDYDRRGPSVGGGLARYQNSDYFDSSSSFYNNEGKRVRRFDPYYDQSDSYYDEGSLYDRYKTDAMNSQRRRYNSQGGGLRRYDPYFDGRRGDLYDENRLYDKGSGAYGLSGNFGPREYRLPSGDRDFYDQYDYDRYYDDYDRGYGGGGMRGGGYGYSDRSGRRSSLGSNRRVAGNSMYERDLQTKYIPEGNGREFGRRIDTRGGGRGPRRGMDGDYYDDDEPRFLGRGSEVDDTMEDFREGRGVKGRPSYNGMGTGGNGNAGFNSQTGYTGNNRD